MNKGFSANLLLSLFLLCVTSVLLVAKVSYAGEGSSLEMGLADFKNENYEEAIPALLKAFDENSTSASTALYIGLAYKETLDYQQSKVYLNKALLLDPSMEKTYGHLGEVLYATNATNELKELLLKAEEEGLSSSQITYLEGLVLLSKGYKIRGEEKLNSLMASEPGSEAATLARKAKRSIKKGKGRLKLAVSYSYQHDDNVMLKPSHDVSGVDISNESDGRSVITARMDYSTSFGSFDMKTNYNFYQSIHDDLKEQDVQGHRISLTPSKKTEKGKLSLMAGYEHYSVDSDDYLEVLSLIPLYTRSLGNKSWLNFTAGVASRDFMRTPVNQDEDRDGTNINFGLGYLVSYGDKGGFLQIKYSFDKDNTDGANWENRGNKGGIMLKFPLTNSLSLNLNGGYYHKNYKNIHTTFVKKRRDRISAINSSLKYKYENLILKLAYTYSKADSNIAVYDYDRRIAGVSVEAVF